MTRRRVNLLLFAALTVLCGAGLWLYWLQMSLTSRTTALLISRGLERLLGGRCTVGELSLTGLRLLGVRDLLVYRPDGAGELFQVATADVSLRFPDCLWGSVEIDEVVLCEPVIALDGESVGSAAAVVGGAVTRPAGGAQVVVRGGTVRFRPLAALPDFGITVGPVDMLLVPPAGEKRPILRANTQLNGAPLELFGESFTAPRRLLFKFYLSDLDVTRVPGLAAALGLGGEFVGGSLRARGEFVILPAGRELTTRVEVVDLRWRTPTGLIVGLAGALRLEGDGVATDGELALTLPDVGGLALTGSVASFARPVAAVALKGTGLEVRGLLPLLGGLGLLPSGLPEGFRPEGTVDLDLSGAGPPARDHFRWKGTCNVAAASVAVDGSVSPLGGLKIKGGTLTVDGDDVQLRGLAAEVFGGSVEGEVAVSRTAVPPRAELVLRGKGVDVRGLVGLLPRGGAGRSLLATLGPIGAVSGELTARGAIPGASSAPGDAVTTGTGGWLRTADVRGSVDLSGLTLTFSGLGAPARLQGSLHLDAGRARLLGVKAVGDDVAVGLDGDIRDPFGVGHAELAVTLGGGSLGVPLAKFLSQVGPLLPGPYAAAVAADRGYVTFSGTLRGPLSGPRIFGELRYSDARLLVGRAEGSRVPLDLGAGRLAFDDRSIWSDPGFVGTPVGELSYRLRIRFGGADGTGLDLELGVPASKSLPLRTVVDAVFGGAPPAGEDPLAGAVLTGRVGVGGLVGDPDVDLELSALWPSGCRLTASGLVQRIYGVADARVDVTVAKGEGIGLPALAAILPDLGRSSVAPLLAEGRMAGSVGVAGPAGGRRLRGALRLTVGRGQEWDLVLGTDAQGRPEIAASCEGGRMDHLVPLLPSWVGEFVTSHAVRLPFRGKVRWSSGLAGTEVVQGALDMGVGAFEVPAASGPATEYRVLGGSATFGMNASAGASPVVTCDAVVRFRSPLETVDPSPVVLALTGLRYADQTVAVDRLGLALFGEELEIRGSVAQLATLGKLAVTLPRTTLPLDRLARKLLPSNAGVSLTGRLSVAAELTGTMKYPSVAGEILLEDVHMESYYQKGLPLSFARARMAVSLDDLVFEPVSAKLGVDQTTIPLSGSLKAALGLDNVWTALVRDPKGLWDLAARHVTSLDSQKVLARALGLETYGKVLRSSAHRIRVHIWTQTRRDPYVYDAFLTGQESLEFEQRGEDTVKRYEELARRGLAAREGFSAANFGDTADRMLRVTKVTSSVLDRSGNQVWPEAIPKWRLDQTPSER